MPANTPIKVCSRALILIGSEGIDSFTDGTAESDVANAMYEDITRTSLTNTRWRFATKQQILNRLTPEPKGRFGAAYQLPGDFLMLNAITVGDNPIRYDIYNNRVFCDESPNAEVIADYIFRANESDWPAYFLIAVEYAMAAVFATSIARDQAMAQMMEQKAQFHMMQARRLDSQQQTTRRLQTSRFIAQRRT